MNYEVKIRLSESECILAEAIFDTLQNCFQFIKLFEKEPVLNVEYFIRPIAVNKRGLDDE